jgi:hypothetical protein
MAFETTTAFMGGILQGLVDPVWSRPPMVEILREILWNRDFWTGTWSSISLSDLSSNHVSRKQRSHGQDEEKLRGRC